MNCAEPCVRRTISFMVLTTIEPMRKFPFAFATAMFPGLLAAQQVQWLTATPIAWNSYPTSPASLVSARDPEHVYGAHLDAIAYIFDQPMGHATLSRRGTDGALLWSVGLGDTVQVESIASDVDGNVVLGGRYFKRLLIDGDPVLAVPVGHAGEGSFLCSWDADGQLLWQQEVSGGPFDDQSVSSIAVDAQGRFWAALSSFFEAQIVRLDTDGSQVESRTLVDSKMIGSISFDPWGGLYVSGATGSPDITVNGTTFPVPESYAFFVTRMNAAGDAQWVQSAEDITFQKPRVQADQSGHAYLLGNYYQPLVWGSIPFADPLWSAGFFLMRLDSLGNFDWGVAPPYTPSSGQFIVANGNALGVDADGNSYVLGKSGGTLDWGNGVATGNGTITNDTVALLSFDPAGVPRWGLQGGSTGADVMYDLSVAADGAAHFYGVTNDPFTLAPYTVDPGADRACIVARVDADLSTRVHEGAALSGELLAYPSVFTTTFRLAFSTIGSGASASIVIIDATGRTMQRMNGPGEELGQGLAPGTYTVLVRAGERTLRTRVVKQ